MGSGSSTSCGDASQDSELADSVRFRGEVESMEEVSVIPNAEPQPKTILRSFTPGVNEGIEYVLRNTDPFSDLSDFTIKAMAVSFKRTLHWNGQAICHAGDPASDFYIIERGEVTITKKNGQQVELEAFDCFGERAIFNETKRTSTAEASGKGKTVVWSIEKKQFLELIKKYDLESSFDTLARVRISSSVTDDGRDFDPSPSGPSYEPSTEPNIWVKDFTMRGIKLGNLLDFFALHCGELVIEEEGYSNAEAHCFPTKLTQMCSRFNSSHAKRIAEGQDRELGPNLYAVDRMLIRKQTAADRVSMAELWSAGQGVQIEVFISHFWGEDFGEFCQSTWRFCLVYIRDRFPQLAQQALSEMARQIGLYVCAFSNNQWNLAAEMGTTVEESPFYRVMSAETTQIVAMNLDQPVTALSRAWCAFEFYLAHSLGKRFSMSTRHGPLKELKASTEITKVWLRHMFQMLHEMDISDARASSTKDLAMIMERVHEFKGTGVAAGLQGADALNSLLRSLIADQVLPLLVSMGDINGVRQALSSKASPETRDYRGIPVLTVAVATHGQDDDVVKLLINRGANKGATTRASEVLDMFNTEPQVRALAMDAVQEVASSGLYTECLHIARREHVRHILSCLRLNMTDAKPHVRALATEGVEQLLSQSQVDVAHEVQDILIRLATDDDAEVRAALQSLLRCPGLEDSRRYLRAGLEDKEALVRRRAAETLQGLAQAELWPQFAETLFALMQDADVEVCKAAAKAIMAMGGPDAARKIWQGKEKAVQQAEASHVLLPIIKECMEYGFSSFLGPAIVKLTQLYVEEGKGIPLFVDLPLGPVLDQVLSILSKHIGLYKLILKKCQITAGQIEPLAKWISANHKGTTEMYLNDNTSIGKGSQAIFSALMMNSSLKCVALSNCGLQDEDAEVLLEKLTKMQLVELNLSGNNFTEGMKARLRATALHCKGLDSLHC